MARAGDLSQIKSFSLTEASGYPRGRCAGEYGQRTLFEVSKSVRHFGQQSAAHSAANGQCVPNAGVSGCSNLCVQRLRLIDQLVGAGKQRGRHGDARIQYDDIDC